MTHPFLERVQTAIPGSEFLLTVAAVRADGGKRFALGESSVRCLSLAEINQLERQGNTSEDWSALLVCQGFDPERVRNCHFIGEVILGRFAGKGQIARGLELPAGLSNSTVANCVLGHDVVIRDVKFLANQVVGPGAVLFDCGRVTCDGETTFGNGSDLAIGVETGGRLVRVYAELSLDLAAAVALGRGRRSLAAGYESVVNHFVAQSASCRGILERGARVLSTAVVDNVYLGPNARVDGATCVADSTLLSSTNEPTLVESGAYVRNSLLQWGSRVSTMAIVESSLLTEHSHVERHGKVSNSILGPNTSVGAGEVTSCLLGPFIACHHQSLLIATLWPEGKGNVGYGANVGSNHTSRAPDQELRVGEGMFFGLGVNVKFPSDFSRAPYTVVACGANLLPQKMTFPFSLISPPATHPCGVGSGHMEIFPGWMLGENRYALRRNESKYRARNKARRLLVDFAILRADTVDLMRDAYRRLNNVQRVKEFYTETDIEGLGKNFLLEQNRCRAVEIYRLFIRYYALLGLKNRLQVSPDSERTRWEHLDTLRGDEVWEHQRSILAEEGIRDIGVGLGELCRILERLASDLERSRVRDERRGERIMEDYSDSHPPTAQDELVLDTWKETHTLQRETEELWLHCHSVFASGGRAAIQGQRGGGIAPLSAGLEMTGAPCAAD